MFRQVLEIIAALVGASTPVEVSMSHATLVDLMVTVSFSAGLILAGAAVIASLPWGADAMDDSERGVRALAERVLRRRRGHAHGVPAVTAP